MHTAINWPFFLRFYFFDFHLNLRIWLTLEKLNQRKIIVFQTVWHEARGSTTSKSPASRRRHEAMPPNPKQAKLRLYVGRAPLIRTKDLETRSSLLLIYKFLFDPSIKVKGELMGHKNVVSTCKRAS